MVFSQPDFVAVDFGIPNMLCSTNIHVEDFFLFAFFCFGVNSFLPFHGTADEDVFLLMSLKTTVFMYDNTLRKFPLLGVWLYNNATLVGRQFSPEE